MRATIVLGTSAGGVGTHVRSLVDRLPGLGIEVGVACPEQTEQRFGFRAAGATYRPVPIGAAPRPRQDWSAVRALRAAVAGSDVVHAHGFRAAGLTGLAMGRRSSDRTPMVATWHNVVMGSGLRRRILAELERLAARRADVTLGVSSDLVRRARELGAPDARLVPVPAARLRPSSRDRDDVRAELDAGERPVVLAVGRLAPQKDYDTLIRAAAGWQDRAPRPLVLIAGDGPDVNRLQQMIDADGLPVRLLGRREDMADLLAAADVYVLTSRWEGTPLAVQEAMALGVPVVATAVGGIPEMVADGAMLVPAGDDRAVSEQVGRLVDDPELRAQLAGRGRDVAASWPDEAETARQVAAVYREVAND
jgi:glycosyltransferase involved in cell wall biosynthesis